MTASDVIFEWVSTDLGYFTTPPDRISTMIRNMIEAAKEEIKEEGIILDESSAKDQMLIATYTSFLYRKRKGDNYVMPRHLRYMLNNRLLSQKAREK